jgi:hypothetical protein
MAVKQQGRKFRFGHRLNETVQVNMGTKERELLNKVAKKLDLTESRLIYEIIFGISKHIEIPKEG